MREEWGDIENYKGLYQVSSWGNVKSLERMKWNGRGYYKIPERILKPQKNGRGYLQVVLCQDGKRKWHLIHRLVGQAFIPNPNNLPQINHISEDKEDNRISNLEWCTCKENINHGTHNQRAAESKSKPIFGVDRVTGLIAEFPSAIDAERQLGIDHSHICRCLKGKQKSAGGFYWYYLNTDANAE